jgi:1,2-diacylglycerol 3-alpha-glucosyltransferase
MYEMNTHYVPGNSKALKRFVAELALGYSQLCDRVIAPSGSVRDILKERGLNAGITVIPTGIDVGEFSSGDGDDFRKKAGIPQGCFLAGYLGRMEEEKNMMFLMEGIIRFMKNNGTARFLAVGGGDLLGPMKEMAVSAGVSDRTHFTGVLKGKEKKDAYHAMDVFAFASKSETQGLVLAEAMASGVPVIGLDAAGVRDIVKDGVNGFLLKEESLDVFSSALDRFRRLEPSDRDLFAKEAKATAEKFDFKENSRKVLDVYKEAAGARRRNKDMHGGVWAASKRYIKAEMELVSNMVRSAGAALDPDKTDRWPA